jgi:hypothetical protein
LVLGLLLGDWVTSSSGWKIVRFPAEKREREIAMQKEKATPNYEAASSENQMESNANSVSNDTAAQRRRVLAALRLGPKSTIQLRRDFDILMPAARIFELKKLGSEICSHRVRHATDCGKLHSVALYVLTREGGGQS